jgi:hypothetical protein
MYSFFCSFLVTMFIVLLGLSDHYVLVWVVVVVVEELAKPVFRRLVIKEEMANARDAKWREEHIMQSAQRQLVPLLECPKPVAPITVQRGRWQASSRRRRGPTSHAAA